MVKINAASLRERSTQHPITGVSWWTACHFARSKRKRLPTRSQWEKAARGETTRLWPWGNTWDANKCNSRASKLHATTPVRRYKNGRSPYGCYDMAGNVFEWLADDVPTREDRPWDRPNHGGSYNRGRADQTTMCVEYDLPSTRMTDCGFRCAFVIPGNMAHLSHATEPTKSLDGEDVVAVGQWLPGARER